jgi:hypothetical protein
LTFEEMPVTKDIIATLNMIRWNLTELYHLPFFGGEKRAIFGIYSPGLD